MKFIALTPFDLFIASALVMALALITWIARLGLARQILVAAGRMVIQLLLVGMILKFVFEKAHWLLILFISLVMVTVAGREILARQKRPLRGIRTFGIGTTAMFLSSFSVTLIGLTAIIQAEPWYSPQYAIPILGMMLGNTMNGIALSIDRLTESTWQQRSIIEQRLMLGQTPAHAIKSLIREGLRSGMIPIINSMSVAGLVSLPGMMTGQILAGSPPVEAVKYQIFIWLMIAAGAGFGMLAAVFLTSRQLFDDRQRLCLDRLKEPENQ